MVNHTKTYSFQPPRASTRLSPSAAPASAATMAPVKPHPIFQARPSVSKSIEDDAAERNKFFSILDAAERHLSEKH